MATYSKKKGKRGTTIEVQIRIRGTKISKTFPDKQCAKAWALNIERDILIGKKYEIDKKLTLKHLMIKYKKEFNIFKARTKDENNKVDRLIKNYPWLVNKKVTDLTTSDFIKFKTLRLQDSNICSTNNFRATNIDLVLLGAIFRKSIEVWQIGIENNPVTNVDKLPNSAGRYRPIKRNEYRKLLNHNDDDWKFILRMYRNTGMRPIELHALTWKDIDYENKKIVVRKGKGNKFRLVDVTEFTLKMLRKRNQQTSRVLPISQHAIQIRFRKYIAKLGIEDLVPYDFRRQRMIKLVDAGLNIGYVANQFGHNSFEMVSRYYGTSLRY